jgi:hypothetical protein
MRLTDGLACLPDGLIGYRAAVYDDNVIAARQLFSEGIALRQV